MHNFRRVFLLVGARAPLKCRVPVGLLVRGVPLKPYGYGEGAASCALASLQCRVSEGILARGPPGALDARGAAPGAREPLQRKIS